MATNRHYKRDFLSDYLQLSAVTNLNGYIMTIPISIPSLANIGRAIVKVTFPWQNPTTGGTIQSIRSISGGSHLRFRKSGGTWTNIFSKDSDDFSPNDFWLIRFPEGGSEKTLTFAYDVSSIIAAGGSGNYELEFTGWALTSASSLAMYGCVEIEFYNTDVADSTSLQTVDNELAIVDSNVDLILADTNEMQVKLPTNNIMGSSVKTDKDDEIDAILTDTNELQSDWTDGGRLDLILDAIDTQTQSTAITEAVWDAVRSSYNDSGSMGEAINYLFDDLEDNIRGADDDDLKTLSDQLDSIATAVSAIQNSVFFSATIRDNYQRPDTGTRTERFYFQVFDATGSPVDPSGSIVNLAFSGSITGSIFSGSITRESTGVYYYDHTIDSADNLEDWKFVITYTQDGKGKTHFRSSQLSEFASDLNDIQSKVDTIHGKLPSNYIMGSGTISNWDDEILAIFNKLPSNYIMGSSVQSDKDIVIDNIYIDTQNILSDIADVLVDTGDIKTAIITAEGSVIANSGANNTFQSDLTDADDFWIDAQVLMISGSNAGQVRRISDFANTNGVITVSSGFNSNPALNDEFIIIGRVATAGSTLTESTIANAVWEELLSGHITSDSAAVFVKNIKSAVDVIDAIVDSIQLDTNDIQSRLPATLIGGLMRAHTQAKDSTLPLSAQEKLDVNEQVDIALGDYDGVTQSDLDTAEANIIAEIDANEVKIDAVQVDITTLLNRIGVPASTIYQAILDTIAEVDANETLILTLTGDLATHDAAIKALIGTPIVDLVTDMNNRFDIVDADNLQNYNAIIQIQNNTTTVFVVPATLVRPDTGTKPYLMVVLNRDSTGNMEDFDADPVIQSYYISGGILFPPAAMTRDGIGQYSYVFNLSSTTPLGAVNINVTAVEGGNPIVLIRTSEVTDFDDELAELKADTEKIIYKLEADTPDPTIPSILSSMETDIINEIDFNQTLIETISNSMELKLDSASLIAMDNGATVIDNGGFSLPIGSATIPIVEGSEELFPDNCFIAVGEGVDREILEVVGTTNGALILSGVTTLAHDDSSSVKAIVTSRIRLYIESLDGLGYKEADSVPSIAILSAFGTVWSGSMTWDSVTESYYYDISLVATENTPGKYNVIATATVDTVQKNAFAIFEVLDRPATQQQIDSVLSGGLMPGTFIFDHDGWKDNANIVHEWTDIMAGPLHDDTGKPATGILVRAYLKGDDDQYLLVNNPPFQNYSNIFGHYRGSLEAGTYLFTFYKDNHKWKEVERTIGNGD